MNNDIWTAIASIFTGKGGTIKLTIFGSLIAATIYEILGANYNFSLSNSETSVFLTTAGEMPQQAPQSEKREDISVQEATDGGVTEEPQQA